MKFVPSKRTGRQSTIDRAVARNILTARQGEVAARLYAHWRDAMGAPELPYPLCYYPEQCSNIELQCDSNPFRVARNIVDKAAINPSIFPRAKAKAGTDIARLLENVVCRDKSLGEAAEEIWGRRRSNEDSNAVHYLRIGLYVLAERWGLPAERYGRYGDTHPEQQRRALERDAIRRLDDVLLGI